MTDKPSLLTSGYLMPIGGAEDKKAACTILSRFVEVSGGKNARIVVIPAASQYPLETEAAYQRAFARVGLSSIQTLHVSNRQQANDPANISLLREATGIFFTGGDQLRLLSLIGGTAAGEVIRAQHKAGVTIAGTSAGASALSRFMIAFGRSGMTPSQRMVQLAPGLGLTPFIIDQHFSQRKRLGRLLTAVAMCPGMSGVGIDEDTALLIAPDGHVEVIGSGTVTFVDGACLEDTDLWKAKQYEPVNITGLTPVRLAHGQRHFFPVQPSA